jgi:hypothetical protein
MISFKKMTPILDKLLEYKRNWIQHVNRMPSNRLPRVMKHYCRTGRRNHGRPMKRLLDTWDRNGSTSGPTTRQIWWWWWWWWINYEYVVYHDYVPRRQIIVHQFHLQVLQYISLYDTVGLYEHNSGNSENVKFNCWLHSGYTAYFAKHKAALLR